jgi:hypothetical protein
MASGLPDARWNNADVTDADVDLDAVAGWYRSRDVPWGIRVPLRITIAFGTGLFVKRCFALLPDDLTEGEGEVDARMVRVQPEGLARFIAAEAAAFDTPIQLAARWIKPVFGTPGFVHWVAERDRRPLAVATTVSSAGDAGSAVMLTGLGSVPGGDPSVTAALARAAVLAAADDAPAALVHTYGDPGDDRGIYRRLGFTEIEGLQVRLVGDS